MPNTILVVDDNPANLLLLRKYLAGAGYRAIATADAQHGLELARSGRVDLITLDLYMDPLDGRTMLRALREDPATRDIPVVLVTVDDEPDVGADGYVPKPVRREDLLREVRRLLPAAR